MLLSIRVKAIQQDNVVLSVFLTFPIHSDLCFKRIVDYLLQTLLMKGLLIPSLS